MSSRHQYFVAENPQQWLGKVVGNGHCVALVQAAAKAPHTSLWRAAGDLRMWDNLEPGLVIATFQDDRYQNRTNGDSHAALLLAVRDDGIEVIDQWVGQPTHTRVIRWEGTTPANSASAYSVVIALMPDD